MPRERTTKKMRKTKKMRDILRLFGGVGPEAMGEEETGLGLWLGLELDRLLSLFLCDDEEAMECKVNHRGTDKAIM